MTHLYSVRKLIRAQLIFLLLSAFTWSATYAVDHTPSKQRVDPSIRLRTEIDGNNVRTSIFNFVFSGRTGVGQGVPYEWPKNTGRDYVALVALFFGGEVKDDTGRIIRIVDLPAFRTNASSGADWNMNPIPGYFNKDRTINGQTAWSIAKSDDPTTWPQYWPDKLADTLDPGWAGKWDGYFGKNQFSADQEMYYRVGDDNYTRYLYTPDTTDPSRRGLGLLTDVRVLEWSQVSVADAVFFIQEVQNDGTKNIPKAAMTIWLADFVGGDGDSQDDTPDFDLINDIAFSLDSDGLSPNKAFQNVCVGAAATLYLETPGNAVDRIDNDGDSPEGYNPTFGYNGGGPVVTGDMLDGEIPGDGIDNNHDGLIDEDSTYIAFGTGTTRQTAVAYADGIDNNDNGEPGSPVVTQEMIDEAATDSYYDPDNGKTYHWNRWPPNPESDTMQRALNGGPIIHLIGVIQADLGKKFKDNIDNNDDGEAKGYNQLPRVTQAMIDTAASDVYHRYRVPGTNVILYNLMQADSGKRYLNKDGLRDVGVDEGIDEMIDESRNDGIDNDGDWNPLTDDVGLDGAPGTGDFGEGDGKPTSGVGTVFPGEPSIDKTDIKEADQIGLTNVQYLVAGGINFTTTPDIYFWATFMLPGSFVNPSLIHSGDYDLFVSSGVFPLDAGQIERISYAVVFGNATHCPYSNDPLRGGARTDAMNKRKLALIAYQQNYKFAQAPYEPTVTAIAGDHKVTLYWDSKAERSFDRFIAGIDAPNAYDFEGYRIYRATDPAFEDARLITDALGNPAPWLFPLQQFDLKDGITGFDSVGYNGTDFWLGDDSGLLHSWTDTSVQNGQKYYYAVRSYDKGYYHYYDTLVRISPTESNLKISIDNITGKVTEVGSSVAIVTPEAPAAGYRPPHVSNVKLVQGSTTGYINYTIVDPTKIRNNHTYRITFEDTVHTGGGTAPDTFLTKNFTLADITDTLAIDTLIGRSPQLGDTIEQPMTDGFRLTMHNEKLFGVNATLSRWNNFGISNYDFQQWKNGFVAGLQKPSDYKIVFGAVGIDTSTSFVVTTPPAPPLPAKAANFQVYNTSENKKIPFAFADVDTNGGSGVLSVGRYKVGLGYQIREDKIIFLEKDSHDSLVTTWSFGLKYDSLSRRPGLGDTMTIVLSKLFRASDMFEFTTQAEHLDVAKAKTDLDRIKVVPNPYIAVATWEEKNPYTSGRGPREIHFNHCPALCTIRIFNVAGELVATIAKNDGIRDGTAKWNLLTRDNLDAAYGVYVYHIDAPGIGEKIGKFAIVK